MKMNKMGSLLANAKGDENKVCPDCKVALKKISSFYRCPECTKCISEPGYFDKKENQEDDKDILTPIEKKYNLRNGESNKKKMEPEVIDLIDSDEENERAEIQNKNNENDKKIDQIYKDWLIGQDDVESLDRMLKREANNNITESKANFSRFPLTIKAKYIRLNGFKNDNKTEPPELILSEKDGIQLKIVDNDNKISVVLGTMDLKYCACIFFDPVYVLLMHINQKTAELYLKDLKNLESFEQGFSPGEIATTRLIVILDMKKEDLKGISKSIYNYFASIQSEVTNRINFIKLPKAKELIYSSFKFVKDKPEEIAKFTRGFEPMTVKVLLKYPLVEQPNCSTIQITNNDYSCLKDGEFLNDNIISFYLKYLLNEVLTPEDRKRTHIFDTFFYQKLTHQTESKRTKEETNLSAAERRYLRVKNWTRNVNIFEKDFLIIPINKNVHWYLAIVCYPYLTEPVYEEVELDSNSSKELNKSETIKKETTVHKKLTADAYDFDLYSKEIESADEAEEEDSRDGFSEHKKDDGRTCLKKPIILIFDSLQASKTKRVMATIKEYLECEWNAKYSKDKNDMDFIKNMSGMTVDAPLQTNYFDCGIYLLQYVESFFTNPIKKFNTPMNLENWFGLDVIKTKRNRIKELIVRLRNKQSKSENNQNSNDSNSSNLAEDLNKTSISKKLKQKQLDSSDEDDSELNHKHAKKIFLDNQYDSKTTKSNGQTTQAINVLNDLKKLS